MATVSQLAKKTLENKWYKIRNKGEVVNVFEPCSFCEDSPGNDCVFCRCPMHICSDGGWNGLVHDVQYIYNKNRKDKKAYFEAVDKVIKELEELL